MQKFFGVIFLIASAASGLMGWRVWHEMGEHSVNILLVLVFVFWAFFLLVVGVRFMRGLNTAKTLWRMLINAADD